MFCHGNKSLFNSSGTFSCFQCNKQGHKSCNFLTKHLYNADDIFKAVTNTPAMTFPPATVPMPPTTAPAPVSVSLTAPGKSFLYQLLLSVFDKKILC